ncbi:MAG: GNAT family N-acetyltransferase, partial [Lachnospiraceae bacterium]|nr:GNAT family N-acetyltransferase [Lachnospiraceae bacterium]
SHPAFSADGFTFVTLGFDDYKTIYKLQQKEPYLLPARIKNLSETELYERYQNEHEFGRLHPLLHPYGIAGADGSLIGYVAVEQSDLLSEAMNLSYYIVPQKRGIGFGQKAVAAFLNMQAEAIGDTMLLAVIERSNTASVRLAAACGFRFIKEDHPLYKLSRGDYRIMQYKP